MQPATRASTRKPAHESHMTTSVSTSVSPSAKRVGARTAAKQKLAESLAATATTSSPKSLSTARRRTKTVQPKMEAPRTKKPAGPRHWSPEEDALLVAAVDKHGPRQWKLISRFVPSRSHTQCLQRWNKVLKPGLLKGPWSPEEDHLLRALVEQSLATLLPNKDDPTSEEQQTLNPAPIKRIDWVLIAENIPGRSVKQCRERWCSNLDPRINKGAWSKDEDKVLLETQARDGNCWAHIARLLPGRTEHAVKTRFRSILRARRREWNADDDKRLVEQYKIHGADWVEVAKGMGQSRTKNGVMSRFKHLHSKGLVTPDPAIGDKRPRLEPAKLEPSPISTSLPAMLPLPSVSDAVLPNGLDFSSPSPPPPTEHQLGCSQPVNPVSSWNPNRIQDAINFLIEGNNNIDESTEQQVPLPMPDQQLNQASSNFFPGLLPVPQLNEANLRLIRRLSSNADSTYSPSPLYPLANTTNVSDSTRSSRRTLLKRYSDSWGGEMKESLLSLLDMEPDTILPLNTAAAAPPSCTDEPAAKRQRSGIPSPLIAGNALGTTPGSRLVRRGSSAFTTATGSCMVRRGSSQHGFLPPFEGFASQTC